MLVYLGTPVSLDTEFGNRHIKKFDEDTLFLYDVVRNQTLNDIGLFGNVNIFGNYKASAGGGNSVNRTFPLLSLSTNDLLLQNNVANSNGGNIPPIMKVPFWNPTRGDGKGFSIDLGLNPVKLKVFQDTSNSPMSRLTISTSGLGETVPGVTINKETLGNDVNGTVTSNYSTAGEVRGIRIVANKSFKAKYLGIWFNDAYNNTQMAIYSNTGVYLGKTAVRNGNLSGRQLYQLETPIDIVNGETYIVAYGSSSAERHKRLSTTGDIIYITSKTVPFNTNNITLTGNVFQGTLPCIWIENNWDESTAPTTTIKENNALNIWANGMVSIGESLNTATYANPNAAGDQELNPGSLLVQNDINIGLSGAKVDSIARLHIKATQAEFTANRYIAFFGAGDGINAGAVSNRGEYVVATAGGGFICLDAVNGTYYRIFVSGGTIQIQPLV